MKQTVSLFPFDRASLPLLRNNFYPDDWQFTHLISPKGYGFDGKDASIIDYGEPLNIDVTSEFKDALSKSDAILFVSPESKYNFEKDILPRIYEAIDAKKNIYLAIKLDTQTLNKIYNYAGENKTLIILFTSSEHSEVDININIDKNPNYDIDLTTPVVFVMGLSSGLNKFASQVYLYNYFKVQGYKPLLISSREYGALGGCLSIPDFMFAPMDEIKKVNLFKNYVKKLEISYNPDVFIIGIPGGLIPLDSKTTNQFGITAFEISRAIKPDATLLCVYTEEFSEEYWKNISAICKYRFSSEITACVRYNALFLFSALGSIEDSKFLMYDPKVSTYKIGVTPFPIFEDKDIAEACKYILTNLEDNATSEAF